jgi:hypothetical protein
MSRPIDELQQLLKNLHLGRMAQSLPEELQRAEKDGLAYAELLLRLVRAQWHHRQETALEWRIRQARLPERWALETFPFKDQPGVNKRQIMSLAELDFIPIATNNEVAERGRLLAKTPAKERETPVAGRRPARGTVERLHSRAETPKGPTAVGPFDFSDLIGCGGWI